MHSAPADACLGVRSLPQRDFSMDARLALAQRALDPPYYLQQNDVTVRPTPCE